MRPARNLPRPLLLGGLLIGASVVLAVFPSAFAPYNPIAMDYNALLHAPSWAHPMGTDNFGRDVFSRVIHAYTIDMQIAFFGTVFSFTFGIIIGALVGYAGGLADTIFGRIVDAVITFPFLVLVIAIVSVLGPGLVNMYIALAVVGWVFYARIIAAEVKVQKRLDYADAGRAMGYTPIRIIFRHLLGSSLGYLGLGAQPPAAEWGVQIADGKNFMTTGWWISVFPGIAIVVTGLGFSLIGDGLAEVLRTRK